MGRPILIIIKVHKIIFESERMYFSLWQESDLPWFAKMNADKEVMRYFPQTLSRKQSAYFLEKLQKHQEKHGYCYFKVIEKTSNSPMGFVGLALQTYPSHFTPATDIGWRLRKEFWGQGYATEGAEKCLHFAFYNLRLKEVISTCIKTNHPSENVMKKIGMQKQGTFLHPNLENYPEMQECLLYKI